MMYVNRTDSLDMLTHTHTPNVNCCVPYVTPMNTYVKDMKNKLQCIPISPINFISGVFNKLS